MHSAMCAPAQVRACLVKPRAEGWVSEEFSLSTQQSCQWIVLILLSPVNVAEKAQGKGVEVIYLPFVSLSAVTVLDVPDSRT